MLDLQKKQILIYIGSRLSFFGSGGAVVIMATFGGQCAASSPDDSCELSAMFSDEGC